jgi:AraC-like DNA-binding protein
MTADPLGHTARRLFLSLPGDTGPGPESQAPRAQARSIEVPPDLRPVIGQALVWREALPAGGRILEHVLPDGAVRLWFDLSDTADAPVVLGPRTDAATVTLQGRMAGLSLMLRPAAARVLLGAPVAAVRAQVIALSDLWGPDARALGEQLAAATSQYRLGETLWHVLRHRLDRADWRAGERTSATRLATALARGDAPVVLGLGERRVQQLCAEHLGLTPREHRRLGRWHGLLRHLRELTRPDWAGLALEHGWYDQAHMLRDFRAFAGMTPSQYRALAISGSSKTAVGSAE